MNRRTGLLAAIIMVFVTMAGLPALAAAPRRINYQGYLTNPGGVPLTGAYTMNFALCDAASGGNCPWSEDQEVLVDEGVFNVALGTVTPLTLAFDIPYFLAIKVAGETMTTRQPLTSVGYAIIADRALIADSVPDGSISDAGISPTAGIQASKISGLGTLATKSSISNSDLTTGSFSNITGVGPLDSLTVYGSTSLAYPTANAAVSIGNTTSPEDRTLLTVGGNTMVKSRLGVGSNASAPPRASLEVGGTDGLLVTGTVNTGTARALGAGVRLHWYPRRGAFRAGMAESSYWDDDGSSAPKLALYSVAMGYMPRATGAASYAFGAYNYSTGDYSLTLGSYNQATASHAIAIGTQVFATGIYSMAFGSGADTNGMDGAMVFGDDSYFQTAHAKGDNSLTMRFTGYNGSTSPYAYKFMTGYPEDTSPYVYMVYNDSSWRSSCSRDLKENFTPVDGEWLLGRIRDLPITQWNYKTSDSSVKYIGPVAEDFWDAFKLGGTDNKGISNFAIEGVNIAGVQALEKRTSEMQAEITAMKGMIELLKAEIEALKAQVTTK